jgi:hypothetical protein
MSDLASRLRAEALNIPPTADPGLAGRIRSRLPEAMPSARPHLRFPVRLAAAAGLIAALGLVWLLAGNATPPAPQPVAVMPPAPPTLSEILRDAGSAVPGATVNGELAALGADFAAVARTVRSAVPF